MGDKVLTSVISIEFKRDILGATFISCVFARTIRDLLAIFAQAFFVSIRYNQPNSPVT
ncbi:hypothetical protein [Aquirufa salirivi]|uniref:Uncharacterized protein n=1 Tax=Aquirufa salirivi TaxID=3104729 RepID=A0ABW8S008_9BACT